MNVIMFITLYFIIMICVFVGINVKYMKCIFMQQLCNAAVVTKQKKLKLIFIVGEIFLHILGGVRVKLTLIM